jgi:putative transcriptional regulator
VHHGRMSDVMPGQLLVAAPILVDPNFADTVVLILDANDDGTLGVILNRPSLVPVADFTEPGWSALVTAPEVLYKGGPVGTDGALALARLSNPDDEPVGWQPVFGEYGVVDLDSPAELIDDAIAGIRIFAGYSGWEGGQLEAEIEEGAWYVVPSESGDVLTENVGELRRTVLRRQPGERAWVSTRPADPELN